MLLQVCEEAFGPAEQGIQESHIGIIRFAGIEPVRGGESMEEHQAHLARAGASAIVIPTLANPSHRPCRLAP